MPHLDIDRSGGMASWIFHSPLCHEGSWIYIWADGKGGKEKKLVKIPFGSVLVLRDDVWHGGVIGGRGNVHFHGAIIASEDLNSASKLRNDAFYIKQTYAGMEVDYNESINLLNDEKTDKIQDIVSYMKDTSVLDESFYTKLV